MFLLGDSSPCPLSIAVPALHHHPHLSPVRKVVSAQQQRFLPSFLSNQQHTHQNTKVARGCTITTQRNVSFLAQGLSGARQKLQTQHLDTYFLHRSYCAHSLLFRHSVIPVLSLKAMIIFEKTHTFNSVSTLIDKNIHTLPPSESRHEYMRIKRSFEQAVLLLFSSF